MSPPRPFHRFVNRLADVTQKNKNLQFYVNKNVVTLRYTPGMSNLTGTFVTFEPSMNKRGVEVAYGHTNAKNRRKGFGTRLRGYGVQAARAAGVPLWQYGINLNMLVPKKQPPISTQIMRRLGAERTRGIPRGTSGKIAKKQWATIVRGHRYSFRTSTKKSSR
jgi:hypothetical protein